MIAAFILKTRGSPSISHSGAQGTQRTLIYVFFMEIRRRSITLWLETHKTSACCPPEISRHTLPTSALCGSIAAPSSTSPERPAGLASLRFEAFKRRWVKSLSSQTSIVCRWKAHAWDDEDHRMPPRLSLTQASTRGTSGIGGNLARLESTRLGNWCAMDRVCFDCSLAP
jgi:hypothetical protein